MKNLTHIGLSALLIINIGISSLNLQKNDEGGYFTVSEDIEITKMTQEYLIDLNLESKVYKNNQESITDLKAQIDEVYEIFEKNDLNKDLISAGSFNTRAKYDYSNGKSQEIGKYSTVSLKIDADSNEIKNEIVDALSEFNAKRFSVNPKSLKLTEEDIEKTRKKLVKIIKNKAENIANSGGFKLGKVKSYSENMNTNNPIMFARTSELDFAEAMEADTKLPESKETSKLRISIDYFIK